MTATDAKSSSNPGFDQGSDSGSGSGSGSGSDSGLGRSVAGPRRWPVWRWLLGGLTTLLLVIVLLLAWVLTTQGGLRLLADLGQRAMPGALEIGAVEGSLIDDFQVRDLRLRLPELDLRVGLIDLQWRPARLLVGTLSLVRLHVRDTRVLTAPSATPKEKEPLRLPEIKLPLALEADALRIERLDVAAMATPDQPMVALTEAELALGMTGSTADLRRLSLVLSVPDARVDAKGQVELRGDYPTDLQLDWTLAGAPAMTLTGQGRVVGDARELRIEHRISGSADVQLKAELRDLLTQPDWTATIQLDALDLPALVDAAPAVDLSASLGSEGNLERASVTGTLNAEAPEHAEMGRLAAEFDLVWEERALTIRALTLTEQGSGGMLDARGRVDLNDAHGQVSLNGGWEALRWPLTGTARLRSPRGSLDVQGQLDAFDFSLSAGVVGDNLPESEVALQGTGDREGIRVDQLKVASLGGEILGKGRLGWSPELTWQLALTARDIDPGRQWSGLDGRLGLKAESAGSLADGFDYQLKADIALGAYPAAVLNLAGKGTTTSTRVTTLGLETLGGQVSGTASVDWAPDLAWDAALTLSDIDPGQYASDWPGYLSGRIDSSGRLTAAGPELSARISDFGGKLRGYPVKVAALIELAAGTLKIQELVAQSAATRLTASGRAADSLAIDFSFRSPNLNELLPAAEGRLDVDGGLRGPVGSPRVTLSIDGRDLALQGQGIASIKGHADLGLGADDPITAKLDGANLVVGGMRFPSLRVSAEGTRPKHRASLALTGEMLSAQLTFAGQQPARGGYRGDLEQLKLSTGDFGTWSLRKRAPVVVDQGRIQAGPLCLGDGQGSSGCVDFNQARAGAFDASLKLDRFELARLDPLVPPNLDLNGHAVLDATFQSRDGAITGRAGLRVPDGALELALPGASERLVFSTAATELTATAAGVDASLSIPLEGLGALDAKVRLPGMALASPDIARQALTGSLRLQLRDLTRVGKLVPDVSNIAGTVAVDATLGGTLGQPVPRGQARLENLGFQVPLIGLVVSDVNVTAQTQGGERLDIDGRATIGGGALRLSGDGARGAQGWSFKLDLDGDQLKVADTKEYMALLKTDLSATFGPGGSGVSGVVDVEEARIAPRSIPAGTVSSSPDVVVEGEGGGSETASAPFRVDVTVRLSDSVLIEAFGLRANLRGSLRAIQEPKQPLLGDGQLEVVDGTYRLSSQFGLLASVGAPLKIEQGILVFAKTPITNPGLVLRAQREGGDMTAGVRVLGTLKKPKLAFFSDSDPNMTDSEIVNYLLTGVPPKGNASSIDRSLSVGAYIAPKLFVEYESNLGDQADKVKMRYDLNNWIQLQTETGDAQGADIFFKFEN